MMRLGSKIWPGVLLCAVVILINWKITLTDQYTLLDDSDIAYQAVPWYQFSSSQIHKGQFPLWESYLWSGQPLVGQVQPGVMHPLHLLYLSLPLRDGHIQFQFLHWYFVLLHCIAAVGAYCLIRSLGRSIPAALLGGMLFGVGGYIGTTRWVNIVHATVYIPWALLFLGKMIRGESPKRNAAFCGFAVGLSWLAGHHNIPVLLILACVGWWLFAVWTKKLSVVQGVMTFSIFGVMMPLVGAAQIIPSIEYGKRALRWLGPHGTVQWNDVVPYDNHKMLSFEPGQILGIFLPISYGTYRPYLGLICALLIGYAIISQWKKSEMVRAWTVFGVASLFYAFGASTIFHGVLYSLIPFVEKARWPGSALSLFHCAASVLCAFGFDAVLNERDSPLLKKMSLVAVIAFAGWLMVQIAIASASGNRSINNELALAFFLALLFGGCLYAWRNGTFSTTVLTATVIFLSAVELAMVSTTLYADKRYPSNGQFIKQLDEHNDIAAFLKEKGEEVRTELDFDLIQYNFGDWHGINTNTGYLPSLTLSTMTANWAQPAKRLLAIRYFIGKKPLFPSLEEVLHSKSGMILYEDKGALSRSWVAHEVRSGSEGDLGNWLASNPDDLHVVFSNKLKPRKETCSADEDRSEIVRSTPNHIEIKVTTACSGIAVLSDTFYPGWKARLDGKKAEIHEVNYRLRGVEISAGTHHIAYDYRPASVLWGSVATMSGFLIAAVLVFSRVTQ